MRPAPSRSTKRTYRYYKTGDALGFTNGQKFSFDSPSFARLVSFVGDPTTTTLSDDQIRPYADHYYEYADSTNHPQQVTKEVAQAAGSSSATNPGLATFTYSYAWNTASCSAGCDPFNNVAYRNVETLPDGNSYRNYSNYYGQPMLRVFHNASTNQDWEWFIKYDGAGRALLKAQPSALSGYDESQNDLLDHNGVSYFYLNDNTGRIDLTDYFTGNTTAGEGTAGDVNGYVTDTKVEHGKADPAPALIKSVKYYAHTAGQANGGATVYPVAKNIVYRNGTSSCSDPTNCEETDYTYGWLTVGGQTTTRIQSRTLQPPVVLPGQNGPPAPGVADVNTAIYDAWGRVIWSRNSISPSGTTADGYIQYREYDPATGALSKTIADVDMTKTGDFQNPPAGWTTPAGGGLHLITLLEVDGMGRTTKRSDPVPNPNPSGIQPNITYTVYNDALAVHEVRTYPGWLPAAQCPPAFANGCPTGPTQVTREVRPAAGSGNPLFTETLTMSAVPDVSGGRPTGTEGISAVQSLTRRITNSGAQVIYVDHYIILPAYSSSPNLVAVGTQFARTSNAYDNRGRQNQVTAPTNTITQTDYDGLGRVSDVQVGTTTAAPVMVSQNVYDGGGVGDGTLTQQTLFPRDTSPNRVNQFFWDWRDRPVAGKWGVQATETDGTHRPIVFLYYDNLNEITAGERYDGDGVTISVTNGVVGVPPLAKRRARVAVAYDNQQRLYQVNVSSINQGDGTQTTSSTLNTNAWYDHRGNLIKVSQPGGLVTKTQYDGVGRPIKAYTTDDIASPTWADAGTVSANNVLSQVETTYDSNNNPTFVVDRERFHNETTLGALGNPTTAPLARVTYVAGYYDAANRLTDVVDVGTNAGSTYTRPTTPDPRSATALRTTYGYAADQVVRVAIGGCPPAAPLRSPSTATRRPSPRPRPLPMCRPPCRIWHRSARATPWCPAPAVDRGSCASPMGRPIPKGSRPCRI
jgi:YD repeat-containing protein